MAETQEKHLFSFQELAEALVKKQGLHEGLWAVYVEFGIGAANFNTKEDRKEYVPAAIVPVKSVGLLRSPEENNLTVDASKVNPKTTAKAKASKSKRKRT
ncbi:MAG TPA: hypothetical protein VNO24_19405 [Blastocatellia bacterium]|nr:hypothetical protein [Blastocatellia bacterium]